MAAVSRYFFGQQMAQINAKLDELLAAGTDIEEENLPVNEPPEGDKIASTKT